MPTNGNLEPLRDFLVPRVKRLVLIDQPHPGSDHVMPKIEVYRGRRLATHSASWWLRLLTPLLELTNQNSTQVIFKIRDFLSVWDWALRDDTRFDYFIGMEGINTLAGLVLKRLGRVGKVIYYVLDYSPQRFGGWLNKIYLALDRFCATRADCVWDVSPAIHPARIASGLDPHRSAPVIHVPIGVYPNQIRVASTKKNMVPYSLVYLGTLTKEQGPDLAIEAMPMILQDYPQATLHLVGGGQKNLDRLKSLAASLRLGDHVIFHGFVVGSANMAKILSRCHVALAPYRTFAESIRRYGDSSKLRSYAAAGLPIVTTCVPPLGRQLQKLGGAIVASDTKVGLAKAVGSVFANPQLYAKMQKQVIRFARNNTWDNEFSHAFFQSP